MDFKIKFYTNTQSYLKAIKGRKKTNSQLEYLSIGITCPTTMISHINLPGIATLVTRGDDGVYENDLVKTTCETINHECLHQVIFGMIKEDHEEWVVELLNHEKKFKRKSL